jgi:putative ABC transport system permease protein
VLRSFDALALRQMRTRRLRVLLTGFGIVLGVGMVFGVLLLVGTIRHTFDQLIDAAWGKSDVVVMGQANGTMPENTVARLRAVPGVRDAGGMVGALFARLDENGNAIKGQKGHMLVAGFDPRHAPFDYRIESGRLMQQGPEVIVEKGWARSHGIRLGQYVGVATPIGRARLHVVGIFAFGRNVSFGDQGFAGVPLAEARKLSDQPAGWWQVAVKANDRSQADALRKRIESTLGPGFEVKTPKGFGADLQQQLQGLNIVLYFFSGIALFVGGFLILNSFNMTVLQRMREIGMLRTLGATRRMVVRTVLLEALAIGGVGTLLGLGLGLGLSLGLISLMKGLGLPIGQLYVTLLPAVVAVVVGLIATTLGALWPARRAGRIAPVRAALGGAPVSRKLPLRRALVGLALFLPGLLFGGRLWFGNQSSSALSGVVAIAGTMLMFVGMSMAAGVIISPLVRGLAVPLRRVFRTGGRLASDATQSNPRRTASTAMMLTIGLSVIVVNSAMSASFLGSISDQIDRAYARDFTVQYVGLPIEQGGGPIGPEVRKAIAAMPGAGVVTPVRAVLYKFPNAGGAQPGLAMGVDPAAFGRVDRTPMAGGISRSAALAGIARGGVIINRGYSVSAGLHVGDKVPLRGAAGVRAAPVVGILKTTTTFSGEMMQMSLATMRSVYGVHTDNQLLVTARPGASAALLGRRIDAYLNRAHPNLESLSTADVKHEIKTQINQQFNFFNAIIAIAVIVSLLGVINTLAMSVLERTREIGVLRALGASRWLVRATMLDESLLITLAGAIAGIAVGLLIAVVWVSGLDSVIPGITFHFPLGSTLAVAVAAIALGVLAAVLPARRAARLKPVDALSYE